MNRWLVALLLIGAFTPAGLTRASTWSVRLDATDSGFSIDTVPGGGFVASARTTTSPEGFLIVRLDESGSVLWENTYTSAEGSTLGQPVVRATSDGGFCIAGSINRNGTFQGYDAWVARLDAGGGVLWQSFFGGPDADLVYNGVALSDGSCVFTAEHTPSSGSSMFWVLRTDSVGQAAWSVTIDSPGIDQPLAARVMPGGDVVVAGVSIRSASRGDGLLVRLASNGSVVWQHSLEGPTSLGAWAVAAAPSGGLLVGGDIGNSGMGGAREGAFLAQLDGGGGIEWARLYPGPILIQSIATVDSAIVAAGRTFQGLEEADGFVLRTDIQGVPTGATRHGGTGQDGIRDLAPTSDGGIVLGGFEAVNSFFGANLLVEKTDTSGNAGTPCPVIVPMTIDSQPRPIKSRDSSATVGSFVPTIEPGTLIAGTGSAGPQLVCPGP